MKLRRNGILNDVTISHFDIFYLMVRHQQMTPCTLGLCQHLKRRKNQWIILLNTVVDERIPLTNDPPEHPLRQMTPQLDTLLARTSLCLPALEHGTCVARILQK
jgi:hypothetical protein